ncbi:MAG: hypothetical protein HY805_03980 [Nitrospirae bacterium]|nr:hypothetical protein [Nitrospirota bacterium]
MTSLENFRDSRFNPINAIIRVLLILFLFISCGKKEPPHLPSYEKPESPSSLHTIHRAEEIVLLWSYSGDKNLLEGFDIMKKTGKEEGFVKIAFVKEGTQFSDKEFKEGDIYKYKVSARTLKGVVGEISEEIAVNPMPTPPPPTEISFKIEKDSVNISWKHPEGSIFFNIYMSKEKGRYTFTPLNKTLLKSPLFTDALNTKAVVYYTVRALTDTQIRDEGIAGDEFAISPDDYIPSAPEGLQAIAIEKGIQLIWKENPETWVRGYRIYRCMVFEPECVLYVPIGHSKTPAFLEKEQLKGKRLYRVTAIGPTKEGDYSSSIEIYVSD